MITNEQEEFRKTRIGGSDAAAACGVSNYDTPLDLWRIKKGITIKEKTIAMEKGQYLEPLLIKIYQRKTGEKVLISKDTFTHAIYPWMIAHLDGLTESGKILECKTATYLDDKWGETGSDAVPDDYIFQMQHCCTVTGIKHADLIVLDNWNNHRIYNYTSSAEVEDKMLLLEMKFMEYIDNNIEPPPMSIPDYYNHTQMLKPHEFITTNYELEALINKYSELKKSDKSIKEAQDAIKLEILRKMDKASVIMDSYGNKIIDVSKGRFNVNYRNLEKAA